MTRKVAIVATSFRMPGNQPQDFWEQLAAGRDLVSTVHPSRFSHQAFLHPSAKHPGTAYTFAAGSVGDVSGFDAAFFGISPREAALMDPQQRLVLEMSWETFENAGIRPSTLRGSDCGVYVGVATVDYAWRFADDLAAIDTSFATGNASSVAANRLSYFYDLRGPSMAIDTACSSSLVAFHQACRAIVSGEISQALTGAISLHLHPVGFVSFSKATMLSPSGRCRVFDADADGYVRAEGGGMFLLKDYEQAVADGDPILAVVVHSAVNTDGHKSGLTVPSPTAQAALLKKVYFEAGIEPWQVDYIEAHGTGTAVGDPIEARALGQALGQRRPRDQPLLIGSVKGNVGHLEAASGVAGLLKAIGCLRHRQVPAHIGMEHPNPQIAFEELNLKVTTALTRLRAQGPLLVGVNSFGFGGANAHVILENCPPLVSRPRPLIAGPLPIMLSARDAAALRCAAQDLSGFLLGQPRSALYEIAYQSVFGRECHAHRVLLFGTEPAHIATALARFADGSEGEAALESGTVLAGPQGAAFIYSGNGSQWAGMGKQLLADSTFRSAVREVDRLFSRHADYLLEDELAEAQGPARYERTEIAQPALFALQVGITAMLRSRGLFPVAVMGHSVGEVAAAWACGALSLPAAVELIYHRSVLQGLTRGQGVMCAAAMSEARAAELLAASSLAAELSLAGVNSARGVTLAGPPAAMEALERTMRGAGIASVRLPLDYAFHSRAMDSLSGELHRALSTLRPDLDLVPFYSTVTGTRLAGDRLDGEYWWRNVREPVRFERAVRAMTQDGINIFVEIGPHGVLQRYLQDCLKQEQVSGRVITTARRGNDTPACIYAGLSQAVIAGATMRWEDMLPYRGRAVQLPNYPWQRESCWHEVTAAALGLLSRKLTHPLLGHAVHGQEFTWQSALDTLAQPLLKDHAVGGAVVFPGAAYAEIALVLAESWGSEASTQIEDLEIRAPLLLSADISRTLRSVLDPRDGQFAIRSREELGAEPWTLHVAGRVLCESGAYRTMREFAGAPSRAPDFTMAEHLALTAGAGLEYGPAFRALSHGWVEGDTALAVLQVPEAIAETVAAYRLHPALLDAAFQLMIHLVPRDGPVTPGLAFVPTRITRLSFHGGLVPRIARVRLLKRAPHSLLADIDLFDERNRPIAVLEGVRFNGVRLARSGAGAPGYFQFAALPWPLPGEPRTPPAVSALQSFLETQLGDPHLERTRDLYRGEIEPLGVALCERFAAELKQRASSAAAAASGYHHYLDTLAEADPAATLPETAHSSTDIWNALLGDYPDYFHIIHAIGRVGAHLGELLQGHRSLADILPSQVSRAELMMPTLGKELGTRVGMALREHLGAALQALPPGQRLRVLEISERAPTFAPALCRELDFDRADYRFSGTDPAALEEGRRLQEQFAQLEIGSLDAPGAELPADLVILLLDFHTMRDASRALAWAVSQLATGGALLLIGEHPTAWQDFVFGSEPAWWGPAGGEPARPQPPTYWQRCAAEAGCALSLLGPAAEAGAYVLLGHRARAPLPLLVERTGHWRVVCDPGGDSAVLAERLCEELHRCGTRASRVVFTHGAPLAELLEPHHEHYGERRGVIDLRGAQRPPAGDSTEAVLDAQIERCLTAAALAHACGDRQLAGGCWFVTRDAASHLLPPPCEGCGARAMQFDAPLAATVRTLMNEVSDCPVRLLDLHSCGASLQAQAVALARELLSDSAEREVLITAQGGRYVPRLRAAPPPVTPGSGDTPPAGTRLGFIAPGQLRNLRWERYERATLAEHEVEIAVRATGLNFRDVMYTLGLLSDEAIENGFVGASLGMECAGVVLRAGERAAGFSPGDQVFGFAPSSFGDQVITPAAAVARLPAGLSFEAAVTIPSTFLTAYYALHQVARLGAGETVLIHGAAGGVGLAAIQIATWCGAEIFATAGSDEKRDFLRLLGVKHIFDSRSLQFANQILERTGGKGVDVLLNSLAGEAIERNLRILKPFGRFIELGKRDIYENARIGLRPFRNNLSYFGVDADQLLCQRAELTERLFKELLALFDRGVLHALPYTLFDATRIVDAFRYMQQSRQIGKVVINYPQGVPAAPFEPRPSPERFRLKSEASYLVTGGLSGLGLATARWLTERGARHLLLFGRTGAASAEALSEITRLRQSGVAVHVRACDVSDRAALGRLFAEVAHDLPPLRGIVHAAALIEDGLLREASAAQFHRVMAPKALGAHHLDELAAGVELDFFVLYSSATTVFGNPGQGAYVAANAALEALARARRARGVPATCLRLGAIEDVGYLARNPHIKQALLRRMGGTPLNSARVFETLESLLLAERSDVAVFDLDWNSLSRHLPNASAPVFSQLARGAAEAAMEESAPDLRRLVLERPPEEALEMLNELLKKEIGEILRIPPERIDPAMPLQHMGLDSLMGVELVSAVESRLGVRVPVMALSGAPTLSTLAALVLRDLSGEPFTGAPGSAQDPVRGQLDALISQHAAEVSSEQIDQIAARLRVGGGAAQQRPVH